ncbi:MAG: DUF6883 domain-containing protein [Pseudolabrys sp.]
MSARRSSIFVRSRITASAVRGRHKARVFREALGINQSDSSWLREQLLDGVQQGEAVEVGGDSLGTRWRVDIPVTRQNKRAVVRTVWIVRTGEQAVRFVTCWVL